MNLCARYSRGFTLIELTISMTVTVFIGLAVAMVLQAAAYGTSARRDVRRVAVRAEIARDRLNDAIRNARAFLAADNNTLVLWMGDSNPDEKVNLSELQLIEYVSGAQTITSYTPTLPIVKDSDYNAGADFAATAQTLKSQNKLTGTLWAGGVSSFSLALNAVAPIDATLATWSGSIVNGALTEPLSGVASLRQPGEPQ